MSENTPIPFTPDDVLTEQFHDFISGQHFPCVGAKSALNRGRMQIAICDELGSRASAQALCEGLGRFSAQYPDPGEEPVSLVAIFRRAVDGEDDFHARLWRQLQQVHDLDARTHPWAPGVSADAAANDFSFSVAARAFFVVGLHPASSRLARRTPNPTLVFNFHEQFEAMRASGRYDKLKAAIRTRDMALQGDINPVLAQFGDASEAQQYSGKNGGVCPFHAQRDVGMTAHCTCRIAPQSGHGFRMKRGDVLRVVDPCGEQVSDLFAFAADNPDCALSSGRSIDYASKIYLTTGDVLWSNDSRPMFTILRDDVRRHDFLLTPCSQEMFEILYKHQGHHPSCFENLANAFAPFGIEPHRIGTSFNIFMRVDVGPDGTVAVLPPLSKAGDVIELRAEMDLVCALTACSAEGSNNGAFKPIDFEVLPAAD